MPRALVALAVVAIAGSTMPIRAAAAGGPTTDAPRVAFALNGQVNGTGVPLNVSWPKSTPDGAPLARYELEKSLDQGAWTPVSLSSALTRSLTVRVKPWKHIQFRIRAVDTANASGEWAVSGPRWLSVAQENDAKVGLASGWQTVSDSKAYGKARAVTWTAGASAAFSFIGRQVAWVAPVGPTRGTATVNSSLGSASVKLTKSSGSAQRIVYRAIWPDNATHEMSITSALSNSNKAVDVDAFLVLSDPPMGTLVGTGDIASCSFDTDTQTGALVKGVLDEDPSATAFTTGDNVYPNGTTANFENCYDPAWGEFKARTWPSPGNHDYSNVPGASGYFGYFGSRAGPPGKGWYRYEAGTWRVYSLNSEYGVDSTNSRDQLAWLKADLAANPHHCVLAMWHRPRFSTGEHGNSLRMAQAYQALYDAGADVVVNGHDHGYQRFTPANPAGTADSVRGIREFVAATGGAGLYAWESESPIVEVRDNTTHGVLRLSLLPGSYSWQFLPVPGPTGFTDTGTAACH
jgi:hypothetical protein